MREIEIQKEVQVLATKYGHRLFRNNTGMLKDERGRPIKFGLCPGSSDLIGWTKDGRFLACEVKRPNKKPTPAQALFIKAVNHSGGYAFVASSVELAERVFAEL